MAPSHENIAAVIRNSELHFSYHPGTGTGCIFSRMIIADGRGAAAPEDEKVFVDPSQPSGEDSVAHRQKGRGLIGGLTPNDNLTRRRLTYT